MHIGSVPTGSVNPFVIRRSTHKAVGCGGVASANQPKVEESDRKASVSSYYDRAADCFIAQCVFMDRTASQHISIS